MNKDVTEKLIPMPLEEHRRLHVGVRVNVAALDRSAANFNKFRRRLLDELAVQENHK